MGFDSHFYYAFRFALFVGTILGSFLIVNMGDDNQPFVSAVPSSESKPGKPLGPEEPPEPFESGDPPCFDKYAWGEASASSTVSCVESNLAALTEATQKCVNKLAPCTSPPSGEVICVEVGKTIVIGNLSCEVDDGFFWDSYASETLVYCARNCTAQE